MKKKAKKASTESNKKTKRANKAKHAEKALSVVDQRNIEVKHKRLEKRLAKRKTQIIDLAIDADLVPEGTQEREYFDEYTHIFKSLQKLTRIAERKYQQSKQSRDIYSLMAMYSQMRECIADLRSIQDLSEQSERIVSEILNPMNKNVGEVLIEMFFQLKTMFREQVKDTKQANDFERQLKDIFGKHAIKLQEANETAKQKVLEFFSNGV